MTDKQDKPSIAPGFRGLRKPSVTDTMASIKTILAGLEADKPRIQYSHFVANYLPLLAAPPEVDSEGFTVPRRLDIWLDVCKTPSNSVIVYDDNDPEKVIIEVPPLIPEFNPILPDSGQSMHEWSKDLEYDRSISPIYADRRFDSKVDRRFGNGKTFTPDVAQKWDAFIVAHGYPSLAANPMDYQQSVVGSDGTVKPVATPTQPTLTVTEDDIEDL